MVDRSLPARRNPLLAEIEDDEYRQEIISKRKLGQTELAVEIGQIGTSNATKPKNLGLFDYAHVRVPLPRDLKGSGIFHASRGHSTPGHYFLMRRSSDGFISGSGMFKVTFPWAAEAEESAEKAHLKSITGVDKDEIAGNVWIPPQQALDLAAEYGIRGWIQVLLDPRPIPTGSSDADKDISSPPIFHKEVKKSSPARATRARTPTITNGAPLFPAETSPQNVSPRKRALRSASPTKQPAPESDTTTKARKIATPKRPRRARGTTASVEPEDIPAPAPTTSRRKVSSKALAPPAEEEVADSEKGADSSLETESIKVKVRSTTELLPPNGDEVVETTSVAIETPAKHPQVSLPGDAQTYLDSAKKAIAEAKDLKADHAASVRGRKRKAVDISQEDDEDGVDASGADAMVDEDSGARSVLVQEDELPAPKRQRLNDIEVRKDRVKKRAAVGIAAGLAFGAIAPVVFGALFGA